ncbi:MAG: hypothetical protein M3296_01805 [Actinomycetota bacterium]|nr:hypothetical protein [Actinomycetota bacterium]
MNEWERAGQPGYDAAVQLARKARGDLSRIVDAHPAPPADLDAAGRRAWEEGFALARVHLTDLLLPDGMPLLAWLAMHEPTEADAQAVEAFAEGAGPISQIRRALFR